MVSIPLNKAPVLFFPAKRQNAETSVGPNAVRGLNSGGAAPWFRLDREVVAAIVETLAADLLR